MGGHKNKKEEGSTKRTTPIFFGGDKDKIIRQIITEDNMLFLLIQTVL